MHRMQRVTGIILVTCFPRACAQDHDAWSHANEVNDSMATPLDRLVTTLIDKTLDGVHKTVPRNRVEHMTFAKLGSLTDPVRSSRSLPRFGHPGANPSNSAPPWVAARKHSRLEMTSGRRMFPTTRASSRTKRLVVRASGGDTFPDQEVAQGPELVFEPPKQSSASMTMFIGRKELLVSDAAASLLPGGLPRNLWTQLVQKVQPGDAGASASSLYMTSAGTAATVVASVLPEICSRHNSPVRPHAVTSLAATASQALSESGGVNIVVVLDESIHAAPAACAVARAFPLFSRKSKSATKNNTGHGGISTPLVRIGFATSDGPLTGAPTYRNCADAANAVRMAARLVDTPPQQMHTNTFVSEARAAADRLIASGKAIDFEVIEGEALRDRGYGGLWNVGKAAAQPPALVVLSHVPPSPGKIVCMIGKGIIYDTGGLSLKSKDGMCHMKADCGGAAAVLAAFEAAVSIGTGGTALHLVLCLAENAIGPNAFRNDDIIKFFSGKTAEVNNCDAEGRLVLADGVAHATALPPRLPGADRPPDLVIDMATLTGAQLVATGKLHAAIVANTDAVEHAAVAAGRRSGDLVHPLPYCPEFYRAEFKSKVADMKNSVKDRSNAQSSCAATFIGEHLHPEYKGGWLHVDLAGPSFIDDRATGYGVALALGLLEVDGFT